MEISSIGEILRRNANRRKYNSGFLFYKNNYVSNHYSSLMDLMQISMEMYTMNIIEETILL